jgi:diguanylate cyclase (GGDEF)-like protein
MDGATLILWLALGNFALCLGTRYFFAAPSTLLQQEQGRVAESDSALSALGWLVLFFGNQTMVGLSAQANVLCLLIGNGLLLFGLGRDVVLCWQGKNVLPQRSKMVLLGLPLTGIIVLAIGLDIWQGGATLWPTPLALGYLLMALSFGDRSVRSKPTPAIPCKNADSPSGMATTMAEVLVASLQRAMRWSGIVLAGLMIWLWHGPWFGLPIGPHRIGLVLSCLYLLLLVFRFGPVMLDLAQKNIQLQRQEQIDLLTDVPNQRGFFSALLPWLALARRPGNSTGLIMIDLDQFKRINDNYGHSVGDQVLQAVARIGKAQLRDSDLIGRLGGETFVVLLPRTEQADAVLVAERVRMAIASLQIKAEKAVLGITASMGVTTIRPDDTTVSLIKRADDALALAKQAGRNRVMAAPESANSG